MKQKIKILCLVIISAFGLLIIPKETHAATGFSYTESGIYEYQGETLLTRDVVSAKYQIYLLSQYKHTGSAYVWNGNVSGSVTLYGRQSDGTTHEIETKTGSTPTGSGSSSESWRIRTSTYVCVDHTFTNEEKARYESFWFDYSASPTSTYVGVTTYYAPSPAGTEGANVVVEIDKSPYFMTDLPTECNYSYDSEVTLSVSAGNVKSSGGYKWYKDGELYATTDTGTLTLGIQDDLSLNGSTFYVLIESDEGLTTQSTSCILKANISTFTPKYSGNLTTLPSSDLTVIITYS